MTDLASMAPALTPGGRRTSICRAGSKPSRPEGFQIRRRLPQDDFLHHEFSEQLRLDQLVDELEVEEFLERAQGRGTEPP